MSSARDPGSGSCEPVVRAVGDVAVIEVADTPGQGYTYVRIVGDVDPSASGTMNMALDQLARARCAMICVDLADTGCAETGLLTFLIQVINCAPAGASVLLCRPGLSTRRVLHLSFLDTIAIVCDDLPFDAAPVPTPAQLGAAKHTRTRLWGRRTAGADLGSDLPRPTSTHSRQCEPG